ncbi:MAG: transporter substrate-binding domain-containing protein [Algicola sp.]|nr:transporter substrate-binding domain-containing protein [Algicola sp.]
MKNHTVLLFSILSVLFVLTFTAPAKAAEFKVVTEHLPPLQYGKNHLAVGGYSIEVVQLLLKKVGEPTDILITNWARAFQMVSHDENVMIFSMTRNAKREKLFHWVGPVASFDNYLWRLESRKDVHINSLEEAKKFQVSVPRNDSQHQFLSDRGFKDDTHLMVVSQYNHAVDLMLKGRVAYFAGAKLFLVERVKIVGQDPAILKPLFKLDNSTNYIAFSLKTPVERVEKFRQALINLKKGPEYAAIVDKWRQQMLVEPPKTEQ